MAPLSGTHIKSTTVVGLSEKVPCRAAWFLKSMYTKYCSVSDMLDELGWPLIYILLSGFVHPNSDPTAKSYANDIIVRASGI